MVPARVSLVTLGVTDVVRSREFYRALGWEVAAEADDGFSLFRTAGALVALYPADALADEMGDPPGSGAGGRRSALAINVGSPAEVDAALDEAVAAGGSLLRPAHRMEWGGYSGYFADPDGHAWEVAHNPEWPLDERGLPQVG